MLAVHKPPPAHFAPPLFRPTHSRHPTAPVVIKPTLTPGLLSLSKPTPPQALRPQPGNQRERQVRSSPRGKKSSPAQQAPARAQAVEDSKPLGSPAKADGAPADKAKVQSGPIAAVDKSTRGRQPSKFAKDKAQRRSVSSCSRLPARRPAHQPSPPPADRIPSQAEVTVQRPTKSTRPPSTPVPGLNDPFAVFESSTEVGPPKESAKAGSKGPAFRPPPPPLAQPSGKLARRRQLHARTPSTPTAPKTQQRKDRVAALVGSVTEDLSKLTVNEDVSATPVKRNKAHRAENRPLFHVCDDSSEADDSDDTPPTTPLRETASVPVKKLQRHWHPTEGAHDGPRTAPLSSTFVFPFVPSPSSSPTPAQRRRNHRRVPSEGVFHLSMDEDSSSSSSEYPLLKTLHPRSRRTAPQPRELVAGEASSAPQAGFFAGSAFQNSPSPDELPPPAF
ncbi:hypothetical protein DAEQUDRAFT_765712 [Daedalea quercina L-15889]|uniref:Uncharacterized protein n=1 Tax=Daedalea quercina L-15889 TaxID=1314783 RepID=A0A165Q9A7_9APHY|nr:hypothetical protein DAEQUDRAFT_765712 [Daedalea quercina L-15889]